MGTALQSASRRARPKSPTNVTAAVYGHVGGGDRCGANDAADTDKVSRPSHGRAGADPSQGCQSYYRRAIQQGGSSAHLLDTLHHCKLLLRATLIIPQAFREERGGGALATPTVK